MDDDRRRRLLRLCGTASVAVACLAAARALPDDGLLGVLADMVATVGVLTALGLPFALWAVFSPDASERWRTHPGRRPLAVAVPVVWWGAVLAVGWIVARAPRAGAPVGATVLLWCLVAAGAFFASLFSIWCVRDRRGATG